MPCGLRQASPLCRLRPLVTPPFESGEFVIEFHIVTKPARIERPIFNRGPNGTSGLSRVSAIAEPAIQRERCNIGKRIVQSLSLPLSDDADPRRVEDHPAAIEHEQIATGRGVPPAPVLIGHGRRLTLRPAGQSHLEFFGLMAAIGGRFLAAVGRLEADKTLVRLQTRP